MSQMVMAVSANIFRLSKQLTLCRMNVASKAAEQIIQTARQLGQDDLMVVLVRAVVPACFACPTVIGFQVKQDITTQLLHNGAPIGAMNCVRKHLSAGKGGQLAAAAYPAKTLSFAISDVPGDDRL